MGVSVVDVMWVRLEGPLGFPRQVSFAGFYDDEVYIFVHQFGSYRDLMDDIKIQGIRIFLDEGYVYAPSKWLMKNRPSSRKTIRRIARYVKEQAVLPFDPEENNGLNMRPVDATEKVIGSVEMTCGGHKIIFFGDDAYLPIPDNGEFQDLLDRVERGRVKVFFGDGCVYAPVSWLKANSSPEERIDYEETETIVYEKYKQALLKG